MSDPNVYHLPVWAPRVSKVRIQRLYQSCAQDLLDEDLVNDVGYSLYSRCISMLKVTEAVRGNPSCPVCESTAHIDWNPHPLAQCANCGWLCPWDQYQKTYQRKWLFAGGLEPFVQEYVRMFPSTHTAYERMVLIDRLIHRFHWESDVSVGGRPGATSLIEGTMQDVMAFLDRLSYNETIPPGIAQTREEWRRKWQANTWSKGKGQ